MYTVSFTLQKTMIMTVHSQYSRIELVSPVYFCNNGTYHEYPLEKIYSSIIRKIGFRFDPDKDEPGGILMYQVQRRRKTRFYRRSTFDPIYAEVIEEMSKMTRLLVTWKIERSGNPNVNVMLIEYDNESILNEDKLAQLYDKIDNQFSKCHNPSKYTLLLHDNTVLAAKYEVIDERNLQLKVTISKGSEVKSTRSTLQIDSTRQVTPLMMHFLLIHIVSLTFQSTIDLTIKNRCTNIELTSPVHFIKGSTRHIRFPQQVNSKSIVQANIITGVNRDTFGGALLYRLQRKENAESDDLSHESAFVWNRDKLKRFYDVYNSRYNISSRLSDKWLLNDKTLLRTDCGSSRGGFKIIIFIYESEYLLSPRKPLQIDLNR
jgi:hypothetical protein